MFVNNDIYKTNIFLVVSKVAGLKGVGVSVRADGHLCRWILRESSDLGKQGYLIRRRENGWQDRQVIRKELSAQSVLRVGH